MLTANGRLKVKHEQCWCKLVSDGQQTKTNELNHVIVFSWLIIAKYSCPSLVLPTVANKERILKNLTFRTCCNALWWLYRQCHAAKLKNIKNHEETTKQSQLRCQITRKSRHPAGLAGLPCGALFTAYSANRCITHSYCHGDPARFSWHWRNKQSGWFLPQKATKPK